MNKLRIPFIVLMVAVLTGYGWAVLLGHAPFLVTERAFVMTLMAVLFGSFAADPTETKRRRIGWLIGGMAVLIVTWFLARTCIWPCIPGR